MNTQEISNKLIELVQKGQFEDAQKELFHQDILSIEPKSSQIPDTKGLDNILEKGRKFRESVEEFHDLFVSQAIISNDFFVIRLKVELTFKGQGRTVMDELIIYKVEDGKIVLEQFFY